MFARVRSWWSRFASGFGALCAAAPAFCRRHWLAALLAALFAGLTVLVAGSQSTLVVIVALALVAFVLLLCAVYRRSQDIATAFAVYAAVGVVLGSVDATSSEGARLLHHHRPVAAPSAVVTARPLARPPAAPIPGCSPPAWPVRAATVQTSAGAADATVHLSPKVAVGLTLDRQKQLFLLLAGSSAGSPGPGRRLYLLWTGDPHYPNSFGQFPTGGRLLPKGPLKTGCWSLPNARLATGGQCGVLFRFIVVTAPDAVAAMFDNYRAGFVAKPGSRVDGYPLDGFFERYQLDTVGTFDLKTRCTSTPLVN